MRARAGVEAPLIPSRSKRAFASSHGSARIVWPRAEAGGCARGGEAVSWGFATRRLLGGARAAAGICDVSRRWRKGGRGLAQPATPQRRQSRRAREWAGHLRDARPGKKPRRQHRERRHRLRTLDAARDAIDAAQRRMIDPRGSDVTAEANEECLQRRAMTTSRKCVLALAVSTTLASRRRRVQALTYFYTANLGARATPSPGPSLGGCKMARSLRAG